MTGSSTIDWMLRDIEALGRIGSKRRVPDYVRSLDSGRSERNANRSILINYEEGKHACNGGCSYCGWRTHPLGVRRSVPSDGEVEGFVEGFDGYRVTVSGGGDPLYRIGDNWDDLRGVLVSLRRLGFLTTVITREYRAAVGMERGLVHQWCFSVDGADECARMCLHDLGPSVRKRVGVVFDPERSVGWYLDLADFYLTGTLPAHSLTVREDMLTGNFRDKPGMVGVIRRQLGKGNVRNVTFLPGRACLEGLYWIAGEATTGHELFGDQIREEKDENGHRSEAADR